MLKTIIGAFAFSCMYISVISAMMNSLPIAIIASMFGNVFYVTFLLTEEDDFY